jgi:hypothetical protein
MRGFVNINYEEGNALKYESVTLKVGKLGETDFTYTFNTGNPVYDYLMMGRKVRELKLDYVNLSSDVDHFTMDGDLYEWRTWPDGSERIVFVDEYTWGYSYYTFTGWISETRGKKYKVRFVRIASPAERKQNKIVFEKTTVEFYSKTPILAIRFMVRELQEGKVLRPEDFEGRTLTKGVQF